MSKDTKDDAGPSLLCPLVRKLDDLPKFQRMLLVGSVLAGVSVLDYSSAEAATFGVCYAIAYVVPICLAGWIFAERGATAVVLASIVLAAAKYPLLNAYPDPRIWLLNAAPRIIVFLFVAAIIVSFRRCFDQLQLVASRDAVTGALNRHAFSARSQSLLEVARLTHKPLLLAFIDLDGFKAVNDRHGHDAGDMVLRRLGEATASLVRQSDCFGRIGGDEFAAVLALASVSDARECAEMLHERISQVLAGTGLGVTCSMGAVLVPPGYQGTMGDLMRRADGLMYEVKQSGKDGIAIGDAEDARYGRRTA